MRVSVARGTRRSAAASPDRGRLAARRARARRRAARDAARASAPRRTRPTGSPSSSAPTPSRAPRPPTRTACSRPRCALLGSHDPRVRRRGARARRQRAHRRPRRLLRGGARARHGASAHHGRARGSDRAARRRASSPPGRSRPTRSPRRSARGSAWSALAFYDAIAPIVVVRLHRPRHRVPRVALRQGNDGGRRRRRRVPQLPDDARAVRGLHRRAHARPTSSTAHEFDEVPYFEGCMPAEEMARRGREYAALRSDEAGGPRRPAHRPRGRTRSCSCAWRTAAAACGTSSASRRGCAIPEQQRVFRHDSRPRERGVPALRLHPSQLVPQRARPRSRRTSSLRDDPTTLFAGQLTGVEGYTESTATGLLAGINLSRMLAGDEPVVPPPTTMLGALYRYLREADPRHFQPMNANFGLLDDLGRAREGQAREEGAARRARARRDMARVARRR